MDKFWIARYCRRGGEGCERRRLKLADQEVPIALLPNGTHLALLSEVVQHPKNMTKICATS